MAPRLQDPAPQTTPAARQSPSPPPPPRPASPDAPTASGAKKGAPAADDAATSPAPGVGEAAGTGVLRRPGQPDRDVPLTSIQKEERVEVGPITKETGVADVLLGSIGIVAVAVIGSLILGAVLGGVLVFVKHRLGWGGPDKDNADHISLTER